MQTLPTITVVIPTRNRAAELFLCLEALAAAAVPQMDCVVVDDASDRDPGALLKGLPFAASLLRMERQSGSARARNAGAALATGDILLFLDDDVCVQADSVRQVQAAFAQDARLGAVIGRYDDAPGHPHFLSQFRNLLHAYTHHTSAGQASTFWTGFGAVRTTVFREHGGFVEESRSIDDVEFGTRISAAGVRIELRPEMQVKHLKHWTLRSMLHTDLFLRGVPWTLLIWRRRNMPDTLNIRRSSRLSVAAALGAVMLAAAACMHLAHWALPVLCVLAVLAMNLGFYAFLHERGGKRFAIAGIGAHWLYLWTAGVSFGLGTAIFFSRAARDVPSKLLAPRTAGDL